MDLQKFAKIMVRLDDGRLVEPGSAEAKRFVLGGKAKRKVTGVINKAVLPAVGAIGGGALGSIARRAGPRAGIAGTVLGALLGGAGGAALENMGPKSSSLEDRLDAMQRLNNSGKAPKNVTMVIGRRK